jgi:cyclophilin family peptidyl-prolyl cis-trans isomerase
MPNRRKTADMTRDPENTLVMTLKHGDVVIALKPEAAPNHVARIKELARAGFYDGIVFHRVIPGFMAQTGDPTGTGSGGSDLPDLRAEFNAERHLRGTVSMARTGDPHSANSQFFICFDEASWLDRQYTVWGQVVSGMEHIDAIKKGGEHDNGAIRGEPDRIIRMRIEADAAKAG